MPTKYVISIPARFTEVNTKETYTVYRHEFPLLKAIGDLIAAMTGSSDLSLHRQCLLAQFIRVRVTSDWQKEVDHLLHSQITVKSLGLATYHDWYHWNQIAWGELKGVEIIK